MIAYVILISIALGLAVAVFAWLRITGESAAKPPVDCKEGTTIMLESYSCERDVSGIPTGNIILTLKNNGLFNIDGVIVKVSDEFGKEPVDLLKPKVSGGSVAGHYSLIKIVEGAAVGLKPGESDNIEFSSEKYDDGTKRFIPYTPQYIKKITIQPFIRDKRKIACIGSTIAETLGNPPDCQINP